MLYTVSTIGVNDGLLKKLQIVHTAAGRVVTTASKFDDISPVSRELQWLPVRHRITCKLVRGDNCLHGLARSFWSTTACPSHQYCGGVGTSCHSEFMSRREAVIINRLNIRHSLLTHFYSLSVKDHPTRTVCDAPLTVKHNRLSCSSGHLVEVHCVP